MTPLRSKVLPLCRSMTVNAKSATVLISRVGGAVGIARLNRPRHLNALNDELCDTLIKGLQELDNDDSVRCIVLAGSDKAFAAGADIKAMERVESAQDAIKMDLLASFAKVRAIRKPIIAAVKGYAFGGGCELAMLCDIIVAASNAEFSQPELTIGTIPGMGGTQRLTRAVGKSKAMEWILTGRRFTAIEAEKSGLISKVVDPSEDVDDVAIQMAKEIANFPTVAVQMAKECVNQALETQLESVSKYVDDNNSQQQDERLEGMKAFSEKRKPNFNPSLNDSAPSKL